MADGKVTTERFIFEWSDYFSTRRYERRLPEDAFIGLTNREPDDVRLTLGALVQRGYFMEEYDNGTPVYSLTNRGRWRHQALRKVEDLREFWSDKQWAATA